MQTLEVAHAQLLDAINALEQTLASDEPDLAALASMRWKLSRASGNRRKVLTDKVYPMLESVGGSGDEKLAFLREQDRGMSADSARHIAKWTPDAVIADYDGYRNASATMRRSMRVRIAVERDVVRSLTRERGKSSSSSATRS